MRSVGLSCTVCNHPARPQIDLAIATGLSKRAVAERFGVSRDAVWRHAQAHLTAEMRAAQAAKLLQREGDTRPFSPPSLFLLYRRPGESRDPLVQASVVDGRLKPRIPNALDTEFRASGFAVVNNVAW
jgi:hypothetical protein